MQPSLTDQAETALRALLRDDKLASGAFVSMPTLCQLLGLPMAAVREAVKRMEARGLLEVLPKRGVMVMRADAQRTRDCLDMRAALDQEGARRLIAAGMPVALAPLRAQHEAVLAAARRSAASPELPAQAKRIDLSLHDALASGLANPLLADVYAANRERLFVIQNLRPFLPDRIVSAMEEHLAIIDALERRDAEAAVAAIRHHHHNTQRWWGVL